MTVYLDEYLIKKERKKKCRTKIIKKGKGRTVNIKWKDWRKIFKDSRYKVDQVLRVG